MYSAFTRGLDALGACSYHNLAMCSLQYLSVRHPERTRWESCGQRTLSRTLVQTISRPVLRMYLLGRSLGCQRTATHPPTPSCLRHGPRRGHAVCTEQYLVQCCRGAKCPRCTRICCFDCERPYGTLHLTCTRIPRLAGNRRFLLCRMCLHVYADDALLRRIVAVDAANRDR